MSRARVRDASHNASAQQQRPFGSLGSMEVHRVNRVRERSWESDRINRIHLDQNQAATAATAAALNQAALNRSWDIDKVPALDRNWEIERARGMEMVYRSMEKEKERRLHLAQTQAQTQAHGHRQKEGKKKKRKRDKSKESQAMMEQIDNNKLSQERLERRIDELNRMLLEEKHQNRKDKLAVAKLQQEVARQKSDRSIRETLTKELDRERMLRLDSERRLRESAIETENYKARLLALQDEFKKMEEMARTLLQYKNKVDQLKQEKATLSISYEKNMQKFRTEVSNLDHENKIVTAELKRLETECDNCQQCNKDLSYRVTKSESGQSESSDKVKMLLERLKRLEEEKSQLVLENENQRQQYEKCLDEIANQVVQALLSQKGLREECGKLQKRVMDLEEQNRQLKDMFHQRIKFASDSFLQAMSSKTKLEGVHSDQSLEQTKYLMLQGLTGSCDSITPLSQISLGSLQSICSNYQESNHTEENDPGKPKPSSPPAWLRDQIQKTDSPSSSVCSPATVETMLNTALPPHKPGGNGQGSRPPAEHGTNAAGTSAKTGGDGSLFKGHLVISHSGTQSAFYPVANGQIVAAAAGEPSMTNQIPKSDQAHLHMLHMQNIALQQQRMHLVTTTPTNQAEPSVAAMVTSDLPNDGGTSLFSVTDIDTKLISSIQNAKKRFSQGRSLQGVNILDGNSGGGGGGTVGRTGSASHTETEFPADNTSPKMKHTSPFASPTNSTSSMSDRVHSRQNSAAGEEGGYGLVKSPTQNSSSSSSSLLLQGSCTRLTANSSSHHDEQIRRRNEAQADALQSLLPSNISSSRPKPVKLYLNGRPPGQQQTKSDGANNKGKPAVSPGKELLKMSDSFNEGLLLGEKREGAVPQKIGDFFDSDSDDSESSRPLSKNLSMASTMSLNELLEKGLDNISTPMDENFSIDNFQIFDSDDEEADFKDPIEKMKWTLTKGATKEGSGAKSTTSSDSPMSTSQQTVTDKKGNKFLVNMKKNEQSEKDYGDYVCLKKIKEYVFMNMPDVVEKEKMRGQKNGGIPASSPSAECTSAHRQCSSSTSSSCSRTGGDCKSSQTSPEEVCQCGSCDDVFLSHDHHHQPGLTPADSWKGGSKSDTARNGVVADRPSDLGLKKQKSGPENFGGKGLRAGRTNKVSPEKKSSSLSGNVALNSSYHDYVNLTPEMVQEILSRESTPSREFNLRKSTSSEAKDFKVHSGSGSDKGCNKSVAHGANDRLTKKDPTELSHLCKESGIAESQNTTSKLSETKLLSELDTASGSSPDSAMQRSYTSTASSISDKGDHLSLERLKYGKDEGYSSNSANSIKTESVLDVVNAKEESISKPQSGEVNSNCNNNSNGQEAVKVKDMLKKKGISWNPGGRIHLEAEVHAHYDKLGGSLTSLHSVSSVESECRAGTVRDLKDYVEGKMEEVRKSLESLENSPRAIPTRHVPKTSPYHHRPHSCSPHRGAGFVNGTAANQKQVPAAGGTQQPVSSLIPKPCLIRHVLRRSHSTSCVIQMAKLARSSTSAHSKPAGIQRKTPSSDCLSAKRISECSSSRRRYSSSSQNGLLEKGRTNSSQECHVVRGANGTTGYGAAAKGHVIKLPSYKSTQTAPNKMKMGISYRRKSETQEERRIVGEGSETGYRSREELRPEGIVIPRYEEEESSVGQTSVQSPAFRQFSYTPNKPSPHTSNEALPCYHRTNCKPVLVDINQFEPDSGSNRSYTSLSGESSSLEESIQLLNGIGLPEGLDDLERQYNRMQDNLKLKLHSNHKRSGDYNSHNTLKHLPNKSRSLDCIEYISSDSSTYLEADGRFNYSKSSLGLHITEKSDCSLKDVTMRSQDDIRRSTDDIARSQDDIRRSKDVKDDFGKSQDDFRRSKDDIIRSHDDIRNSKDDVRRSKDGFGRSQDDIRNSKNHISLMRNDSMWSKDDISMTQDDISLQIESLSRTVEDIQRSLSSLSIDTLVGDDEEGEEEAGTQQEVGETGSQKAVEQESETVTSSKQHSGMDVCGKSPQGMAVKIKQDSSQFLASLILLGGCSDDEGEEDNTSCDSDVFWDSPPSSWHMHVSGENPDRVENCIPVSLLGDLSPSPTCPRSSGDFPQVFRENNIPSNKGRIDSLSTFQKEHMEGRRLLDNPEVTCCPGSSGDFPQVRENMPSTFQKQMEGQGLLHNSEVTCSETTDFYEPFFYRNTETINARSPDILKEDNVALLPFHVDKFVDSSPPCGKSLVVNNDDGDEDQMCRRFSLAESPIVNQRVAKLREESRLEKDTSIHRVTDATLASTNELYKAVLSNASLDSNSTTVSNASSNFSKSDTESTLGSSRSRDHAVSKFDCLFYKTMARSFESAESSVGVDGWSLSDSCGGSLSEQESE